MNRDEKIEVRRTTPEDLPAISEIRLLPAVAVQQYRLDIVDTPETWEHLLFQDPRKLAASWTLTSDDTVIGYAIATVSQVGDRFDQKTIVSCGWNLHPDYWGRGIMHRALTEVLDDLFGRGVDRAIADRFEQNDRCLGLLNKLGFTEIPISLPERLWIWVRYRCRHRVIRTKLDITTWSALQPLNLEG